MDIGNNLVDIAAVTTLIGATTAESLTLGSRGAAGMPWAAMSSFGSFYLVKACVAGSLPGWIREAIGINSSLCNSIIGVSATLNQSILLKANAANPVGIAVRKGTKQITGDSSARLSLQWLYNLDEYTSGIVHSCPSFKHGSNPHVYAYARDGPRTEKTRDWIAIAASFIKLIETIIMWYYGDWRLTLASTLTWAFFFFASIILQLLNVSREYQTTDGPKTPLRDIITGQFPTVQSSGTELKIILNVPENIRSHLAWRLVWAFGGIIGLASNMTTYIILGKVPAKTFYIWTGFQIIWLFLRSMFFQFSIKTDGRPNPVVEQNISNQGYRLLSLAAGASWHLAQRHPRTAESYLHDLDEPSEIRSYMLSSISVFDWRVGLGEFQLSADCTWNSISAGQLVDVEILAIIGDTLLASVAWIQGYALTDLDLYDACLAFVKINGHRIPFMIPSGRVLSGNVAQVKNPHKDTEAGVAPQFIPKLGPCRGEDNGWVYWIPLDEDRWLYIVCGLNSIGVHRALVISSAELTRRLELGDLWVSITHADEVKEFVDRSVVVGKVMLEALSEVSQDV